MNHALELFFLIFFFSLEAARNTKLGRDIYTVPSPFSLEYIQITRAPLNLWIYKLCFSFFIHPVCDLVTALPWLTICSLVKSFRSDPTTLSSRISQSFCRCFLPVLTGSWAGHQNISRALQMSAACEKHLYLPRAAFYSYFASTCMFLWCPADT